MQATQETRPAVSRAQARAERPARSRKVTQLKETRPRKAKEAEPAARRRFDDRGRPYAVDPRNDIELGESHAIVYDWLERHCDERGIVVTSPWHIARDVLYSVPFVTRGLKGLRNVGRIKIIERGQYLEVTVYLCETPLNLRESAKNWRDKL